MTLFIAVTLIAAPTICRKYLGQNIAILNIARPGHCLVKKQFGQNTAWNIAPTGPYPIRT